MRFILSLLALSLTACGSGHTGYVNYSYLQFDKTYHVYGAASPKRVILTHGIWDTDQSYMTGIPQTMIQGIVAKGYQVITFTYPYSQNAMFDTDGGLAYRNAYTEFLTWMLADLTEKYGAATQTTLGGFSFGGLHAFVGASAMPGIDRFIAMCPLVDPDDGQVLHPHTGSFYFNGMDEVTGLTPKPGLIITNGQDAIVGTSRAAELAGLLGTNTTYIANPTGNHELNQTVATEVVNWL